MAELPEYLTIRERNILCVMTALANVPEVGTIARWDARGSPRTHGSILVIEADEESHPSAMGNAELITNKLTLDVELLVAQYDATSGETSSQVLNRWLGRIKSVVCHTDNLIEPVIPAGPGGDPPASGGLTVGLSISYEGSLAPPTVEGQPECYLIATFSIEYDEYPDNPYAAPGVDAAVFETIYPPG